MSKKQKAKILAIIPARGGSKSIKDKNIVNLDNKPLIAHTIETAKKSRLINRLIVSTDSPKIAQIAKKYEAEVPYLRPKNISTDSSPVIETLIHCLKWLKQNEKYSPDAMLLLQATSPFRTASQIDKAINAFLKDKSAQTLVSVQPVPHNFLPQKLMKLKGKYLEPDICLKNKKLLHRQTMPLFYARNGPSILITKTQTLLKGKLYGQKILPFIMEGVKSNLDIDTPADLKLAKLYKRLTIL